LALRAIALEWPLTSDLWSSIFAEGFENSAVPVGRGDDGLRASFCQTPHRISARAPNDDSPGPFAPPTLESGVSAFSPIVAASE
jgi:hypothetical protein